MKLADTLEGDEKTGAVIVAKALEAPLRTIVENAGLEGAVVVDKVREQAKGIGFDAVTETYVDMMDAGIIDPVKVTKNALTNAVSISATLLTTEAAVGDIRENKAEAAGNNVDMGY
jgi:chaperonin GroEL